MVKQKVTVRNLAGIHLKPAGCLAKEAWKYESEIKMAKDSKSVTVTEPLAVIGLRVKCGDSVEIEINGADEVIACEGIKDFFENNL